MKNLFFGILAVVLLILVGQWNAKIGLALAGLVLLSSVLLNIEDFKKIMKGEVS
jgi:hypothetical protein